MPDNFRRGVFFMLAASLLFSCSDTVAKYVTAQVPAVELASIRYAVFVLIAAVPLLRTPFSKGVRSATLASRRPALQIARGLGVVSSAIFFILALGRMPIADATAINFVNPILITVLAIPFLGERVSTGRWLAVLAGFAGMLVIVRPGAGAANPGGMEPAALLVLASSVSWSAAMIATRRLAASDRSAVTLFWTAATGMAVLLCLLPFFLQPLTGGQLGFCLLVGVVASGGQWCAVLAYRQAPASVLAPLGYAQMIWSSLAGWLVFGQVPDRWVLTGGAIIAASGLSIIRLERARAPPIRPPAGNPAS